MLIIYMKILKSRKFTRLTLKLSLGILLSSLIYLIIFIDPTCIAKRYQPNITLKSVNRSNQLPINLLEPQWTPIVDNVVSIYSSFRIGDEIKIIAIMDKYFIDYNYNCSFKQNSLTSQAKAKVTVLTESWSRYYRFVSVSVTCSLKISSDWSKVKLLLRVDDNQLETSYITITTINNNIDDHKSLVVCVRPLFGHLISAAQILEFIAYYKANRIDRIIFYELDISVPIRQLLLSIPLVQLLSYSLPIDSSDIHADGQIAALNDCVLRSSNSFVMHVDIDELIVTANKFADIKQFVEHRAQNHTIGALIIPNVMICDEFNHDQRFPRILTQTVRQTSKWEHNDRSKAIILKPLSVCELGIHTIWKWNDNSHNDYVEQSDASLFHYRSCCRVWQPFYRIKFLGLNLFFLSYEDKIVNDLSVRKFKNKVISFLKNYVHINNVSQLNIY